MVNLAFPIILGVAPSLFWLAFFLIEDERHPEPKGAIIRVFAVGGLSAFLAALLQRALVGGLFEYSIIALVIFAAIEEIVKFLAVYFAVGRSEVFDEPVDAMIYMITAAMGFAALENVLTFMDVKPLVEVTILRFIGATLLHAIASGLVGFYWAKGKLITGLLIGIALHAGFNFLILQLPGAEIYASLVLIIAAFYLFSGFDFLKKLQVK